jgi:hypothetical protein
LSAGCGRGGISANLIWIEHVLYGLHLQYPPTWRLPKALGDVMPVEQAVNEVKRGVDCTREQVKHE